MVALQMNGMRRNDAEKNTNAGNPNVRSKKFAVSSI